MSAVVIQELAAGAKDASRLTQLNAAWKDYDKDGRLLVPNGEDWYLAGKVLNSLHRGLRSKAGARAVSISKEEQQRILRDVLIARTAKRAGAQVVTKNQDDFEKIKRFCSVATIHPDDYFI